MQNAIINWHFATILWCYTFCMKIQGRKCTLTVLKDNEFIPLPYSEETVRLTSKGYTLPSCIGRRNRLKCIETGKLIQGCFVTRLEYLCTKALFLLLFYNESTFDSKHNVLPNRHHQQHRVFSKLHQWPAFKSYNLIKNYVFEKITRSNKDWKLKKNVIY